MLGLQRENGAMTKRGIILKMCMAVLFVFGVAFAVVFIFALLVFSCTPEHPMAPDPLLLSYSGYFTLRTGGQLGHPGSGVIVIVHVHNHGKRVAVVPVDFEKNPWVYVEWTFVREDETWEF